MKRRWLGVLLCALLIGVSTSDAYVEASQKNFPLTLNFETSYFSLDTLDDSNDTVPTGRAVSWSPREKVTGKLILGAKVRRVRFTPPPSVCFEKAAHPGPISQDVFRFQEVFRI
jgi:hypothetical protein